LVGSVTRSDVTLFCVGTRINEILDVSTSKKASCFVPIDQV
jgi:hypothetical protein